MKIKYNYSLLFFAILVSCGKNHEKTKFVKTNPFSWFQTDSLYYNFENLDPNIEYLTKITVAHNTDYKYQNIIFLIKNQNKIDTINLQLAKKNGTWKGTGVGSKRFYSQEITTRTIKNVNKTSFVLTHSIRDIETSRIKKIKGIASVGLELIVIE